MTTQRTIRVAGLAALTLALVACGTASAGNPTAGPGAVTATVTATQTETEVATATQTATVTATPLPPPAPPAARTETLLTTQPPVTQAPLPPPTTQAAPPPTDPTRSTVVSAFGVANRYWNGVFASWEGEHGEAIHWTTPRLFHGDGFYDSSRGVYGTCGDERRPADNAGFCGNPGTDSGETAWDLPFMRDVAADGDSALYEVVAHEVGHAAQWRFWYDDEGGATPRPPTPGHESPPYEQQADCIAGVTLADAERDGYLPIDLDLDAIHRALDKAGDDGSSHGTPAQRIGAFDRGYNTGDIESCLYNQGQPPTT